MSLDFLAQTARFDKSINLFSLVFLTLQFSFAVFFFQLTQYVSFFFIAAHKGGRYDEENEEKEGNKIIKYNQGEKSIKSAFIIYADLDCLLEKMNTCYNNQQQLK